MENASTAPAKRSKKEKEQLEEGHPLFRVDSKDYSETFESKSEAIKQANYLKKRAVKEQESVKVTVTEVLHNKDVKVIHSLKIGESFYK